MSEDYKKAQERISKLLNMTVENGCSEDEQETALRLAASAATKAGIDLDAFRAEQAKATGQAVPKRSAKMKASSEVWKMHQTLAAQAAGVLYGVDVHAYTNGTLSFVGREENIELTEQTMMWLMRQVELLYKQHLPRGLSQRDRAQYRKNFKANCAHRVYERAKALMRDMKYNESSAQAATGQNALVVQGYFETLEQEKLAYYGLDDESIARRKQREEERRNALTPQQRELEDKAWEAEKKRMEKRKGPRQRYVPNGFGASDGRQAGDNVQLRKEIK